MANKDVQKIGVVGAVALLAFVIALIGLDLGQTEVLDRVAKTVASIALAVYGVAGGNE